jgi:putative DNA-invertase from lambdoid prophage Rac
MAVYCYCRVSTAMQVEEGESLEVQARQLNGYAMLHDLTITETFVERGVSGAKPLADRPEGGKLLAKLQSGDTILTTKLDRMFRSALDALGVLEIAKKRNIQLHMLDLGGDVCGSGMAKLMFTVCSAFAEAERDRIKERVRDVKRDQRQRQRYLGGAIPFGYSVEERPVEKPGGETIVEKYLVEIPEQMTAIENMVEMRRAGNSWRKIENAAADSGFFLSYMTVRRVVSDWMLRHPEPPPPDDDPEIREAA